MRRAFPERGGFFTRFWRDHQGWGGPYPPWFLDWLGIEREAVVLRMWEPMLIPVLWVLIDELVLSRRVGDAPAMAAQLAHLADMAARPHVTIQVVPEQARAYAGLTAGIAIATDPDGKQAAHLDTGIQGMTVAEPALVTRTVNLLDTLRAEALPRAPSAEMITEAMNRWTAQASAPGAHPVTPARTAVTALRSVTPAT